MYIKEKRKVFLNFVLLYFVSIVLIIAIVFTYTYASREKNKRENEELLIADEIVNNYLIQLNKLNEQYLTTLKFPLTDNKRDSILNVQRGLTDIIDIKIDSISRAGRKYSEGIQIRFRNRLLQFETAFKNWKTVNNLILSTKGSDNSLAVNLVNQLRAEAERIALLEDRLKASQLKEKSLSAASAKDQEEIKFLKWAVRSQVITIKSLENKLKD